MFLKLKPFALIGLLISSPMVFSDEAKSAVAESAWQYDTSIYAIYDFEDFEGSLFTAEEVQGGNYHYLRRIKASASVEYNDRWSIAMAAEYKEPDKKTNIDELTLNYVVNNHLELSGGKFKEPLGLENQLSLKYQPLLERSTPTQAFLFGRNTGLAADIEFDTWTLDLAVTEREALSERYENSYAKILRATYAPWQKKKKFIHFGVNYSTRDGIEDQYDINEVLIAEGVGNLIHSPNFAAQEIELKGAELAARYKHLLVQSEYFKQTIVREGIEDTDMDGYYVTAVYTLLGTERDYQHGKLKFSDNDNIHTVEIAARYSETDLAPVFQGDEAEVTSVALNYFYKKRLRVSAEYQTTDVTSNGRKNTTLLDGKSINGRVQLAF